MQSGLRVFTYCDEPNKFKESLCEFRGSLLKYHQSLIKKEMSQSEWHRTTGVLLLEFVEEINKIVKQIDLHAQGNTDHSRLGLSRCKQ